MASSEDDEDATATPSSSPAFQVGSAKSPVRFSTFHKARRSVMRDYLVQARHDANAQDDRNKEPWWSRLEKDEHPALTAPAPEPGQQMDRTSTESASTRKSGKEKIPVASSAAFGDLTTPGSSYLDDTLSDRTSRVQWSELFRSDLPDHMEQAKPSPTMLRSIASVCMECGTAFARIMVLQQSGELAKETYAPFEKLEWEQGRFKVWCGNLGALQAGPGSLDARLVDAPATKTAILKNLADLRKALRSGEEILSGSREPLERVSDSKGYMDDISTSEEESEEDESVGELAMHVMTVQETLGELFRLSFKIRRSGGRAHLATKIK
ncbi:hypothetical protein KVT40_007402 [Elsinoe batatas]|uniref:Uncharacterized protein n=1 Tax=Elsinoe batatas TaxID=2601811 RepID=A0A8K0KW19_9PEZI|nr:hypothetical protein KVT40_007402 [Elsinoe batatas]